MEYVILLLSLLIVILSAVIVYMLNRQHGYILVSKNGEKKIFTLELHKDPDEIENMKYVTFRVVRKDIAN